MNLFWISLVVLSAVPIKDSLVLSKIHQTYIIGYIKDVILPRVLDEATIASLNSIIHANNAVVISLLKDDASFIQELFARMRSPSTSAQFKRDMVLCLNELCSLAKSLQMVQQLKLPRPRALGLVDYLDDEDDEDYNPPPRPKPSSADDGDMIADLCRPKHKLTSVGDRKDSGFEVNKKARLGQNSWQVKSVEVSSNHNGKISVRELSPSAVSRTSHSNGGTDELYKERESREESSNNVPCTAVTRQSTEEDNTSTPIGSSSPEMAVKSSNVNNSEPYSVR